jgi:hypothetical protein
MQHLEVERFGRASCRDLQNIVGMRLLKEVYEKKGKIYVLK